jgi:hypothetical protein
MAQVLLWPMLFRMAVVQPTYAVSWQEADASLRSGKLEMRAAELSLDGPGNGSGSGVLLVRYEDVLAIRFAPGPGRLDRRPTLVLDRRSQSALRIASVAQPGIMAEVAEQLAAVIRSGVAG